MKVGRHCSLPRGAELLFRMQGLAGCSNATRREMNGVRQRPRDGREVKGTERGMGAYHW